MTGYLDDDDIEEWQRPAAEKAEALDIGVPVPGGMMYYPDRNMTRAEMFTALDKLGLLPDGPTTPPPELEPEPEPELILRPTRGIRDGYTEATAPIQGDHTNVVITVPSGMSSGHVCRNGVFKNCLILNPGRHPVNSFGKNVTFIDCVLLDVTGDGLKAGAGDRTAAYNCAIHMAPAGKLAGFGAGAKHYDGAQAHADGHLTIMDTDFYWRKIGTKNQTTGVIFTQDQASLEYDNVRVFDPGGTRSTFRLFGTGDHILGTVEFVGMQARNEKHGKMYPRELINHRPRITLGPIINNVPFAADSKVG